MIEKSKMPMHEQTVGSALQKTRGEKGKAMAGIVGNQAMMEQLKHSEPHHGNQHPVQMESVIWKFISNFSQSVQQTLLQWWNSLPLSSKTKYNESQIGEMVLAEIHREETGQPSMDGFNPEDGFPLTPSAEPNAEPKAPPPAEPKAPPPAEPRSLTPQEIYDLAHWDDNKESSRVGSSPKTGAMPVDEEQRRLMKGWCNSHNESDDSPAHPAFEHYGKHKGGTLGSFIEYLRLAETMRQLIADNQLEPQIDAHRRLHNLQKHTQQSLDSSYRWMPEGKPELFMIIQSGLIYSFGINGE